MANFKNVRLAIHCLEKAKSAFDGKITIMNDVRTQLQNSWTCGTDRDKVFEIIQKIQNICNDGKTYCQEAINQANAALNDANSEINRRQEEERERRAERMRNHDHNCQV